MMKQGTQNGYVRHSDIFFPSSILWCLEQFSDFGSMPVGILNLQAKGKQKA